MSSQTKKTGFNYYNRTTKEWWGLGYVDDKEWSATKTTNSFVNRPQYPMVKNGKSIYQRLQQNGWICESSHNKRHIYIKKKWKVLVPDSAYIKPIFWSQS